MIKSDIVVHRHLNFVGGIWDNLLIQISKTLVSCKTNIIRVSYGSSEDQNANRDWGSDNQLQEILDGNINDIGNLTRGCSCYILVKMCLHFIHGPKI